MLSFEIALIQAFYGLKSMPSKRSNLKHISKNRESMGMMRGSMGMMGGSMGMIKGLWVESRGLYVCAPLLIWSLSHMLSHRLTRPFSHLLIWSLSFSLTV